MNGQLLDPENNKMAKAIQKVFNSIKSIILTAVVIIMLFSCENRIEDVRAVSEWTKRPIISADNIEILYSDSLIVKARIVATQMNEYDKTEDAGEYTEFPKGLEVFFYNDLKQVESRLSAGYATYDKTKKLFEARINVEVENFETMEKVNTEQMFWDEAKEIIYSDKFVKITTTNPDGTEDIQYGENGFEADQNFTAYTIKGGGGIYHSKGNS